MNWTAKFDSVCKCRYSESLYALFSVGGLYYLMSGALNISVLWLAISGCARSNGVLNAGYFCFQTMHQAYDALFLKKRHFVSLWFFMIGMFYFSLLFLFNSMQKMWEDRRSNWIVCWINFHLNRLRVIRTYALVTSSSFPTSLGHSCRAFKALKFVCFVISFLCCSWQCGFLFVERCAAYASLLHLFLSKYMATSICVLDVLQMKWGLGARQKYHYCTILFKVTIGKFIFTI